MIEQLDVRAVYLETADAAATLLADPAVATAWDRPSALAKMTVRGLAGHLARQVFCVPEVLATHPEAAPIPLLEHYTRSTWVTADLDDDVSVSVRDRGETLAAGGPAALHEQVDAALRGLREALPAEPAERVVQLPWAGWALTLPDFLMTRLLELVVHSDDLAVSVGVPSPPMPEQAYELVLDLLRRLAVRRHGPVAVLRALSRSERAPATVSAL